MLVVDPPSPEEMARVDAWREEQERIRQERFREQAKRRVCSLHGPGPTGRMLYGPAPYGYGPVCKFCRREWSRRNDGKPWESAKQAIARERAEHEAMVVDVEAMLPTEFYVAWEKLRTARYEATRRYHRDAKPDEFGVNNFGSATPDGQRYYAMRERVWRERRAFEETRDVI